MGQAISCSSRGLGGVLATGLVALVVGGLCFLLFLLLKFNLVHVGRAVSLEATRRIGEGREGGAGGAAASVGLHAHARPGERQRANG